MPAGSSGHPSQLQGAGPRPPRPSWRTRGATPGSGVVGVGVQDLGDPHQGGRGVHRSEVTEGDVSEERGSGHRALPARGEPDRAAQHVGQELTPEPAPGEPAGGAARSPDARSRRACSARPPVRPRHRRRQASAVGTQRYQAVHRGREGDACDGPARHAHAGRHLADRVGRGHGDLVQILLRPAWAGRMRRVLALGADVADGGGVHGGDLDPGRADAHAGHQTGFGHRTGRFLVAAAMVMSSPSGGVVRPKR